MVYNDIPFRGTPQANVGVPDGLVLRVVRNGDMIQEATHITPLKKGKDVLHSRGGKAWMAADYQYTINQSGVITIPVFDQQSICFNNTKLPEVLKEGVQYSAGGGTILLKKVKLPDYVKNRTVFCGSCSILGRRCLRPHRFCLSDTGRASGCLFLMPCVI